MTPETIKEAISKKFIIYATFLEKTEAERVLKTLTTENSAYIFEARTQDGSHRFKAAEEL